VWWREIIVRVRTSAKSFSCHSPFANNHSFCPKMPNRWRNNIEDNAATSPNVKAPNAANVTARCSPMPDNSRRSRGDKNSFSLPAAISRKPGFPTSVESLAAQREFASPPDSAKPTSRETAALNSCQRAAPSASADKSKKPSSMDTGTTNGEKRFITANIRAEIIL